MGLWTDIVGSVRGYIRLGLTGVRLKNSSGALAVRNAGDSAYAGVECGTHKLAGLQQLDYSADIASGATIDLGAATGNSVTVTHASGTLAITSLGGASLQAGTEIETIFSISGGTLSLTHHATNLILAGGANITLANGDVIRWRKMHDSNAEWKMVGGVKANGTAWVSGAASIPLSIIDAAGDLIVGTAPDTAGRLAMGTALQQLRVNAGATGLEWATISGSSLLVMTTFTSNGTWYKSTYNPSKIIVIAFGGGGAGGGGSVGGAAGEGGHAGAVAWAYTDSPATSYTVTIGAGGTGVSGGDGNTGGTTSFGALVSAAGGRGGRSNILSYSMHGDSCFGQGGAGGASGIGGSSASANSAAGGGGAGSSGGTNLTGGNGGSGRVIVLEFA